MASQNVSDGFLFAYCVFLGIGVVIGLLDWAKHCLATGVCPIW